ncbi:MAG: helicase-associated domain-containing protein [Acidimicrobiales bacterium]
MATAEVLRMLGGGTIDPVVVTAFSSWEDERLEALLVARPELRYPTPPDFESLAYRASTGAGFDACRARLDEWCLQVAEAVCLLDPPATVDQLRAVLGIPVDEADLDRALDRLDRLGLVLRSGPDLHAVEGFRRLPFPAGLGPPADQILGRRTVSQLRETARRLGLEPGRNKAAMLAVVCRALRDPRVVRGVVDSGPAGTTDLVEALERHGSVIVSGASSWFPDSSAVGWLVNRGVVAPLTHDTVAITREAGLALRGGVPYPVLAPRPPDLGVAPLDQSVVDAAAAEQALALVAAMGEALDALAATPATILKAGGIGIRDVRRLAKALGRSEAATARLLELAGAAGLAAADPATGTALPLPAYDDWLGLEVAQRWTAVASAWLDAPVYLSVAGAMDTREKPIPPLLPRIDDHNAVAQRREVLAALAGVGEGHGVDEASLRRRAIWSAPNLWCDGTAPPTVLAAWVIAEAETLGVVALGALSTAGRRSLDGDGEGAARGLAPFAPSVVSSFVVQADLSAMAPGELAPAVRTELELVADVESTGAATVYRFGEASLLRGFQAGRTAEEITAFLEAHATRGVPQPLAFLVADVGRRYGRLRVGRAKCYLRCDDPALLAEVRVGRRTAALGLRELAPTVVVCDAAPAAVVAALHAGGYLAAQEDGSGAMVVTRSAPPRAVVTSGRGRGATSVGRGSAGPGGPAGDLLRRRDPASEPGDPAVVVAALREAAAAPPPSRAAPPPRWVPELFDDEYDDDCGDDGCEECRRDRERGSAGAAATVKGATRPGDIARSPVRLATLLEEAWEEQWMVRIGVARGKGGEELLTAGIVDMGDGSLEVECLPGWEPRAVPFTQLLWARVLTQAEEDLVL